MKHMVLGVVAGLVLAVALAPAQTTPGTLSGRISGNAAAAVPNSTIILTDVNTGASQRVTTGTDGSFNVTLPPGTYRVEIESSGFKRMARQNMVITAGSASQFNATLEAGSSTETVELKADAPVMQDQPPEISRGYGTEFVRRLPVFDRNYQELPELMTGITTPVPSLNLTLNPQLSREFNTNGLPAYANDQLNDGLTVREPFTGVMSIRVVPNEAIQQLNLRTSNYRAEGGFAAGTLSNVFVRPGTNNGVHGSAFGFWSSDALSARNPFNAAGNPDPRLHYWQYGGTVGGAIIPDRMFLFGSYEGTRRSGDGLQYGTVPTTDLLAGNFSGFGTIFNPNTGTAAGVGRVPFPNNTIPQSQINPAAQAILGYLPAPNQPGLSNNLFGNVPYKNHSNVIDGRLDYRFTDLISGFLRYGFSDFNTNQGSLLGPVIGAATSSALRNHHAAASVTGNYAGIIGELRFGYNRYRNALNPDTQTTLLNQQLAAANFGGTLPSINIAGLGALGTPGYLPGKPIDNTYNGVASFYMNRGRHQVRFGVDLRRLQSDGFQNQMFGPNGTFFFGPGATSLAGAATTSNNALANSFAAFLLGAPTQSGAFQFNSTPTYRQTWYAGFISDTFKLTSRISIDAGLRYDVYSPVQTRRAGGNGFFDPTTGTVNYAGVGNIDANGNQSWDRNNIAPRIGIAFRPMSHTVIRASYAMTFFPVPFQYLGMNQTGTGIQQGIQGGFGVAPGRFTSPVVPPATTPENGALAQNTPFTVGSMVTPYIHSYYLMIQHDLTHGLLIDADYLGNLGRQLPYSRELNAAAPGTGVAGLPFGTRTASVTEVGSGLTSNYNSLQVNLTKRFSSGVSFAGAYTFSKALDYGMNQINPFDRRANYGPADWDHRHMLTLSHVLDLPFGNGSKRWNTGMLGQVLANWQLNGVFRWTTGAPYTVFADPLACACPGIAAIPANILATGSSLNGQTTLNASDFAAPAANSFGNLGRNSIRGPESRVYNMSLFKSFQVREQAKLELRGEVYNLANSTQFGTPVANFGAGNFGTPTALGGQNAIVNAGGRQFQVGARILF